MMMMMMMMIIIITTTTTTYNNNTLIFLSPYGSFKISAQMIDYDCHEYFDLFNDNMWSTSLLFSLLNSENHEHLKNSQNADLS